MTERTPAGDKGTADRIEADDGAYWVRLVTWQALDREGACMRHCVGDGDYDRLVGGEELNDDAVWSLRDRGGLSILTVRIENDELNYAKGPDNHAPGRGAAMQVRHLAAAFKAGGYVLEVSEGQTEIVLLEDGRTFRRDRLPPEVQAQREAAQPAVRDRGIDEYLYRNDPWYRAAARTSGGRPGPGAPGRLVVEFLGGGMSGAYPGGGGGTRRSEADYGRSIRQSIARAVALRLHDEMVNGSGPADPSDTASRTIPIYVSPGDTYFTRSCEGLSPGGGGGIEGGIEILGETNVLGWSTNLR